MKKFTLITVALLVGCIAVACVGQERVCTPNGCYFVPAKASVQYMPKVQSQPVEQSIVVESSNVVYSQPQVRRPVQRLFAARPVRGLLKRVFCR